MAETPNIRPSLPLRRYCAKRADREIHVEFPMTLPILDMRDLD